MLASRLSYANVTATLALFLALTGGAYAVTSTTGGRSASTRVRAVHGCYRAHGHAKGTLRIVGPRRRCRRGERAIAWNRRGPAGLPGPAGRAGSDASVNGVAAGGSLRGTYPSPSIAAGAVGASQLADAVVAPRHMAQVPAVRASGRTLSVPNGTLTTLPFADPGFAPFTFDTDGMHDAAGARPERLTARTAGVYLVYAVVSWGVNANGSRTLRLAHHSGGSLENTVISQQSASPSGSTVQNAVRLVHMKAGDDVTLAGSQDSGTTLSVYPIDFGAAWIGPY